MNNNEKIIVRKPKPCCENHDTRGAPFLFLIKDEISAQTFQAIESLTKGSHYFVIADQEGISPSNTGFIIKTKNQNEAKMAFHALYDALHIPTFISIDPVDIFKRFEKTETRFFRAGFKDFGSDKINGAAIEEKLLFLVVYKRDATMKVMLDVLDSFGGKPPQLFTIFNKNTIPKNITRVVYFY